MTSVEKLHLRFCKYILSLNKSTCTNMVYGELGITPLLLHAQSRMFWSKIIEPTGQNKVSNALYQLLFKLHNDGIYESQWLKTVKHIQESYGFSGVWRNQAIIQQLADQFLQKWSAEIYQSNKCINYRIFKTTLNLENYLIDLPFNQHRLMTRFRCRNNKLPIEIGCRLGIDRNLLCTITLMF